MLVRQILQHNTHYVAYRRYQQAGLKPTYYCLFLCFRPFYFCLCFYANTMPCVCFILPINVANVYGEEGENQK